MIKDVALIFEGGGTRASYTGGAAVTLLEEGIEFSDVYGISAGSSHACNYISKDAWRTRASFGEFMAVPRAAGWGHFLRGQGYYNSKYIYEIACLPGEKLPFDLETFLNNPSRPHIESYERDTGRTVYWGKEDMQTMSDLMQRVRACSTMPFFMPPIEIEGHVYLDGSIGDSWGIPIGKAKQDGFKKFFIVLTQERGYRKSPSKHPGLIKAMVAPHKNVAERMLTRYEHYNKILDEIDELEKAGDAYVFYPNEMKVKTTTLDQRLLDESFNQGYAQAQSELSAWRDFL
jgi:Predicted esterase of the alpha-beta hydrolase superfamily